MWRSVLTEKIDITSAARYVLGVKPGDVKTLTLKLEPKMLSIYNEQTDAWELLSGEYKFFVGGSSRKTPLVATARK